MTSHFKTFLIFESTILDFQAFEEVSKLPHGIKNRTSLQRLWHKTSTFPKLQSTMIFENMVAMDL